MSFYCASFDCKITTTFGSDLKLWQFTFTAHDARFCWLISLNICFYNFYCPLFQQMNFWKICQINYQFDCLLWDLFHTGCYITLGRHYCLISFFILFHFDLMFAGFQMCISYFHRLYLPLLLFDLGNYILQIPWDFILISKWKSIGLSRLNFHSFNDLNILDRI